MGREVRRPFRSGEGERPTTPKPTPTEALIKSLQGKQPSSPKPQPPQGKASKPDAAPPAGRTP